MVHCLQCKHVAKKLTGFSRGDGIQPKTPKKEVSASSSSSAVKGSDKKGTSGPSQPQPSSASKLTTSTSGKASGVPGTTGAASAGPKGFSFLDKLNQAIVTNRKPTGPAGFSFKNPSTSSTAGQISQKMVNDGDFIPLTKTAFSHMQAEKSQQIVGNKRPHPDHNKQSTGGGGGGVSLLELERLQKKKKRQSLSEGSK